MAPKGRGYKVTPPRVLELLQKKVAEKSQYAVAKETGLSLSVIQGLLKGNREPSTSTLSKLGEYFNVPVSSLRGENKTIRDLQFRAEFRDEINKKKIERLKEGHNKYGEYAHEFFNHIPHDDVELALAVEVLEDVAESIRVVLIKEFMQCHDQSKN